MILKERFEQEDTLKVEDNNVLSDAYSESDDYSEDVRQYMRSLSRFRLDSKTVGTLEKFFRYKMNNPSDSEYVIPYNFIVECDDDELADQFVNEIKILLNGIYKREVELKTISEEGILYGGSASISAVNKADILVINNCSRMPIIPTDSQGTFLHKKDDVTLWGDVADKLAEMPNIIKFIFAPTSVIKNKFKANSKLYNVIFRQHISIGNMTVDEIIAGFHSEIQKRRYEEDTGFRESIDNYIRSTYSKSEYINNEYISILVDEVLDKFYEKSEEKIVLYRRCVPNNQMNIDYEAVTANLSELVGMNGVKKDIKKFARYVEFLSKAEKEGLKLPVNNLHMVFYGNPGTGKTTVARMLADILNGIGMLRTNKIVSVERKDLVGQYIGQTAPRTAAIIEKARGGILFIDEAYSLSNVTDNDYGSEVIDTLLTAMQDYKDDLVCIFAGYKKEMEEFMDSNPGLRSRIGYKYYFEDYSVEELVEIFRRNILKIGFTMEDGVLEKIRKIMAVCSQYENFGNGRFVGTVIQEIIMRHSEKDLNDNNLSLIELTDVPDENYFAKELKQNDEGGVNFGFKI